MRQETLSDHTSDQARAAQARREAEYAEDASRYEKVLEARATKARLLGKRSAILLRKRKFLGWFASLFPRLAHALSFRPRKPRKRQADSQEHVWNAGQQGEAVVNEYLSGILSDDWILFSGYCNVAGELDKILVGPAGILAMEIKYVNGEVYCEDDTWWRDKYDKYGNLVERRLPIADKKGRGPSAQVNDSADRLESFISKRLAPIRLARAIVFSHSSARVGSITNPTVDIVETLSQWDVQRTVSHLPGLPPGISQERVEQLIRQDHRFHLRNRRNGLRSRTRHK